MISLGDFLDEARAFLEGRTTRKPPARELRWGEGPDDVDLLAERTSDEDERLLAQARVWKAAEFDAGFGWISGDPEYGGGGLPVEYDDAYADLRAQFEVPDLSLFEMGRGMVGPTIFAHGSEPAKRTYLPGIHRGDLVACQLFSEPNAGSDLAGLQTRAVRRGDDWFISGQKVWSTNAHVADIGEVLCRSNPDAPKHAGITAFVVDMHTPGVEVRPLRQMTGGSSFNEVFLDDVRVPDVQRLGPVDAGWRVAVTTLMNERRTAGSIGAALGPTFDRLMLVARHEGATSDPVLRDRLADLYVHLQAARYNLLRLQATAEATGQPGPELSMAKLAWTQNLARIADAATAVLGPKLLADTGEWGTYAWAAFVLGVPGIRVSAGTDEIMRNVLAERVLGLPKEPAARA